MAKLAATAASMMFPPERNISAAAKEAARPWVAMANFLVFPLELWAEDSCRTLGESSTALESIGTPVDSARAESPSASQPTTDQQERSFIGTNVEQETEFVIRGRDKFGTGGWRPCEGLGTIEP